MCGYNGTLKIFIKDEDAPNYVSPYGGPWHMYLSTTNPFHNGWTFAYWFRDEMRTTEVIIVEGSVEDLDKYSREEVEWTQKRYLRNKDNE